MTVDTAPALGVMDVGGSHVDAALVREDGSGPMLVDRARGELDSSADRATILAAIAAPALRLGSAPHGWTIAIPGPFDYERGSGDFAGVGKFGAIAGVDLAAELGSRLSLPRERIRFLNDATAFALGEWSVLSPRPRRMLAITLGTGVGSAFLDDGRVVDTGPDVPEHGWAHLIRLDGAPLEHRVSTAAIAEAWRASTGHPRSVREIAALARDGDDRARRLLDERMHDLGRALAPWVERFGAERIVVGGAIARSWSVIGGGLRRGLIDASRALDAVAVGPAQLGDDAALLGAAEWSRA